MKEKKKEGPFFFSRSPSGRRWAALALTSNGDYCGHKGHLRHLIRPLVGSIDFMLCPILLVQCVCVGVLPGSVAAICDPEMATMSTATPTDIKEIKCILFCPGLPSDRSS